MSGLDIVSEARTFLGTRFRHQGRSREGLDCVGLPILVFAACRGLALDWTDYARQATDETMLELCARHLQPVHLDRMQPGDVAVMRFDNQRHMGILGDYPAPGALSLIHANILARKVVEHRLDDFWRARIIAVFRWPEAPCN